MFTDSAPKYHFLRDEERNAHTLLIDISGTATVENSMDVSQKKLKIELSYGPSVPPLGIYQEKNPTNSKDACTPMSKQHYLYLLQDMKTT